MTTHNKVQFAVIHTQSIENPPSGSYMAQLALTQFNFTEPCLKLHPEFLKTGIQFSKSKHFV